jgi:hypothetical protein
LATFPRPTSNAIALIAAQKFPHNMPNAPDCGSWLNLNFPSTTSQRLPRIQERPNASIEHSRPLIMASSSSPNEYSLPLPLQHAASANEPHSKSWRHRLNLLTSHSEAQNELRQEDTRTSARSKHVAKWWKIRLFSGMINDVKRRAPFYWSDWTDAWDYRVVPATVYMYFAKYVIQCHIFPSKT